MSGRHCVTCRHDAGYPLPRVLETLQLAETCLQTCGHEADRSNGLEGREKGLEVGRSRHILLVEDGHLRAEGVVDPGHVARFEEHAGLVISVWRPVCLLHCLCDAVGADADCRLRIRVMVVCKVDPGAVSSCLRIKLELVDLV